MYKVKEGMETSKRFTLAWLDREKSSPGKPADYVYDMRMGGTPSRVFYKRHGFGNQGYALRYLNGEIERNEDEYAHTPEYAGVEDGPLSPLATWFEKV